jgi:hypothetical protein
MTYILKKVIAVSNYVGTLCIRFNNNKNQFELCANWSFAKFNFCLTVLIINFIVSFYYYIHRFSNKVFIINVGAFVFLLMNLLSVTVIITHNKKYEKLTLIALNRLIKFQENSYFQNQNSLLDYVLICVFFVDCLYSLSTCLNFTIARKTENEIFVPYVGPFVLCLFYIHFHLVKIITEARYVVTFLLISKCYTHLNVSLNNHFRTKIKLTKNHQELYELSRTAHRTFSVIILFTIGSYFVSIVVRLFIFYYACTQDIRLLNEYEIVGLFIFVIKLVCIIVVSDHHNFKVICM